jgi:hypothetical protein
MSLKTKSKKPSGLVQLDGTARLQKELKEKKAKPRNLWRRDWRK